MGLTIQVTLALQGEWGEADEGARKRLYFCGEPTITLTSNTVRNSGRLFLRCSHYKDAARDCTFFRWFDEWGETMSSSRIDQQTEAHSQTHKYDDIVPDFWELVRSVEALKISHNIETSQMKQKHDALQETVLRMGMEATVYKRNQLTLIYYVISMDFILSGYVISWWDYGSKQLDRGAVPFDGPN
ncbi:hypothetical protein ACLOJK_009000 [Asimina triloba]